MSMRVLPIASMKKMPKGKRCMADKGCISDGGKCTCVLCIGFTDRNQEFSDSHSNLE